MCVPCTPLPPDWVFVGGVSVFACFLVLGVFLVSFGAVLVLFCTCSATVLLGYLEKRRLVLNYGWRVFRRLYMHTVTHDFYMSLINSVFSPFYVVKPHD